MENTLKNDKIMPTFNLSNFKCPSCNQPLLTSNSADNKPGFIAIWCGYGPCTSRAMSDGVSMPTEQAAYEVLIRKFDYEECHEGPDE